MGGFFGVVSKEDCVGDLFYGIDYHSHLGTKRGGMALCDRKGRIIKRIHDITNSPHYIHLSSPSLFCLLL